MIKVAICDDEKNIRSYLASLIRWATKAGNVKLGSMLLLMNTVSRHGA